MEELKKFLPWIGMVFVAGSVYGVLAGGLDETREAQKAIKERQELLREQTAQVNSDIAVIKVTQAHLKEKAGEIQQTLKDVLQAVQAQSSN